MLFRTVPIAEDGLNDLELKRRPAAVNWRLKHLLHIATQVEDQIPAVLDLLVRVLILKPAPLLLLPIERDTQASGIDPTLTDLAEPPYSLRFRQGVVIFAKPAASEI